MYNHELDHKSLSAEQGTLLERLIKDETERAAAHAALQETDELSSSFRADLARTSAYLKNPHLVEEIRSLTIIPDDTLADAGKNEINLSAFVHRYLEPSEWSKYIHTEKEKA